MDISIIATLYSYEPVIASVTKFGANRLYLLIDYKPDETQNKAIQEVKKTLGKYIDIKLIKTDIYDIVKIAKDCTDLIDKVHNESKILLNVSAARKTKALGLMFAGYIRAKKVDKIFYITKENKSVVFLPKVSFRLNKSQINILNFYDKNSHTQSMSEIYHTLNISKSMFYKTLNELDEMGFIHDNKITDAGRIVLL
jgi:CRISPR-associated protein Csa3